MFRDVMVKITIKNMFKQGPATLPIYDYLEHVVENHSVFCESIRNTGIG